VPFDAEAAQAPRAHAQFPEDFAAHAPPEFWQQLFGKFPLYSDTEQHVPSLSGRPGAACLHLQVS
jgi:hypothetical protein